MQLEKLFESFPGDEQSVNSFLLNEERDGEIRPLISNKPFRNFIEVVKEVAGDEGVRGVSFVVALLYFLEQGDRVSWLDWTVPFLKPEWVWTQGETFRKAPVAYSGNVAGWLAERFPLVFGLFCLESCRLAPKQSDFLNGGYAAIQFFMSAEEAGSKALRVQ